MVYIFGPKRRLGDVGVKGHRVSDARVCGCGLGWGLGFFLGGGLGFRVRA